LKMAGVALVVTKLPDDLKGNAAIGARGVCQ